jgi:hypothetical protein
LKNTGDQITTETYQAPVTSISFWINAFSASVNEIGYIDVEAWNGTKWVTSKNWRTTILSSTKRKTYYITFAEEDNYTQFRLTFTDNGGSGIALDAFTAICSRNITYIYKGKELAIDALPDETMCSYDFNNLSENSTYYFSVQSSDITKGCEEHISEAAGPVEVTTTTVSSGDDKQENKLPIALDSINYDAPTHVVYVSNPRAGDALNIYNIFGQLVYTTPIIQGVTEYIIPVDQLQKRSVYIIKYIEAGKVRRKQGWAKFTL